MKKIIFLFVPFLLVACNQEYTAPKVDKIVAETIENAGGEEYERARIRFKFREMEYESSRKDGLFELMRIKEDTAGIIRDVLNNDGFRRLVDGEEVALPDSLVTAYSESVNAVHYFVQLPFGLKDEAVQKELLGEDEINDKSYYEVKVTFRQEGGGKDHEDVYMYWIDKTNFTVDFMAYRFFVNDGGIRFRVAKNPRMIKGIRFVDYDNYKTDDLNTPLEQLDELYEAGALTKVSEIENEILDVEILD